jgi:hypothetical protein
MTRCDVWAFDVDGCVVDLLGGQALRPHAHALLSELRQRGHIIVLWSSGGADYARRRAEATGISHLVDACYDKDGRDGDGRWTVDHLPSGHRPTVFVDDCPDGIPLGMTVRGVRPFLAPTQYDNAFAELLDGLDNA